MNNLQGHQENLNEGNPLSRLLGNILSLLARFLEKKVVEEQANPSDWEVKVREQKLKTMAAKKIWEEQKAAQSKQREIESNLNKEDLDISVTENNNDNISIDIDISN